MKDAAARLYDRLLILRCQAGDSAALHELIVTYSPRLRFFLLKMSSRDADDLLQDLWFDIYRKINRLRDPEAFPTWIYRIARDKAYQSSRRRPAPSLPDNFADDLAAPEETFTAEEAQYVRAALDTLPEELREVLVLRFLEDLDYQQIALIIDRPLGTVRSRIHYAKRTLREKLTLLQKEHPHVRK